MADFEPPSFSLGLDLDFNSEAQTTVTKGTTLPLPNLRNIIEEEEKEHDFESPIIQPDPLVSDPPRTFKRLRLGPTCEPRKRHSVEPSNVGDDIEQFSSQEDLHRDEPLSTQYHSMCSSSKFPLQGHRVLITERANHGKVTTRKKVSDAPAFASMEASGNKMKLPKLTVSPLRRFQLIDSDSESDFDDPSVSEVTNRGTDKLDSYLNERRSKSGQHVASEESGRTRASVSTCKRDDLRKDLCSVKSFHIPTPALDEVCEEYFRSVKDKKEIPENKKGYYGNSEASKTDEHQLDVVNPFPPAHCYFFNDDPRIQKLVRTRLPNFLPLDAVNNEGYKLSGASGNDYMYMNQFSHGEGSKQAAGKTKAEVGSRKNRKNSKKSNSEDLPQGSGSWVNPKHGTEITKDAGKRRVHAFGQSSGHWYMAQDGKRVYINKNGQELTGQIAYRHYRKESGAGFKRSKKSKKKTAAKKKKVKS